MIHASTYCKIQWNLWFKNTHETTKWSYMRFHLRGYIEYIEMYAQVTTKVVSHWRLVYWINEVWVGVGEIDPEGSGSLPKTAKPLRAVSQITRDQSQWPRRRSRRGQWARSRGINPDSHTKWVDNSGSATTVLVTEYLYNDAKCLFLSERWVFFSSVGHLCCFDHVTQTDQSASIKWDYCPASWL